MRRGALGLSLGLLACSLGEGVSPPPSAEASVAPAAALAPPLADAHDEDVKKDRSSETSSASPPPASAADFEAAAAPLRCQRALRCGEIGRSELDRCLADPAPEARANDLLGVTRGVAAGRYTFDPEAAARCLGHLRDAPCRYDIAAIPRGCLAGAVPSYLRPAVAAGGACERWEECVDGHCSGDLGCPGTCVARTLEAGGSCGPNVLCGDDLFCDHGTCRARGEVGESCRSHWQGCREGLICAGFRAQNHDAHWPSRGDPGTCAPPRALGEPCGGRETLTETCRSDLFCDYGQATPSCRARLGAGAPCTWLDACADGLTCVGIRLGDGPSTNGSRMRPVDAAGVCAPFADVGAACDPDAILGPCPASQPCDAATRTCSARPRVGERCDATHRCTYGHYCDRRTGTCQASAAIGEACRPGAAGLEPNDGPCFLSACDRKARTCERACARR